MTIERETVPCQVCGAPTDLINIQFCERCVRLETAFQSLTFEKGTKAREWLRKKMKEQDPPWTSEYRRKIRELAGRIGGLHSANKKLRA